MCWLIVASLQSIHRVGRCHPGCSVPLPFRLPPQRDCRGSDGDPRLRLSPRAKVARLPLATLTRTRLCVGSFAEYLRLFLRQREALALVSLRWVMMLRHVVLAASGSVLPAMVLKSVTALAQRVLRRVEVIPDALVEMPVQHVERDNLDLVGVDRVADLEESVGHSLVIRDADDLGRVAIVVAGVPDQNVQVLHHLTFTTLSTYCTASRK